MEKIADSIRELIEKNDFLNFLMQIVEYLIYGISVILILMPFIEPSDIVDTTIKCLIVITAILSFASKKYISLSILLVSCTFSNLAYLIENLLYTDNITFSWHNLICAVICFIIVLFVSKRKGQTDENNIKILDTNKIKSDMRTQFIDKINKYNQINEQTPKK